MKWMRQYCIINVLCNLTCRHFLNTFHFYAIRCHNTSTAFIFLWVSKVFLFITSIFLFCLHHTKANRVDHNSFVICNKYINQNYHTAKSALWLLTLCFYRTIIMYCIDDFLKWITRSNSQCLYFIIQNKLIVEVYKLFSFRKYAF